MPQIENTTFSRKVGRMWGLDLHSWEQLMLWSLGVAALAALAVVVTTAIVVTLQKAESERSNELVAKLNNDTARLQADNLALQTVLLPRSVGSIGLNGPPKAVAWFAGMEAFTGTEFVVQSADDLESRRLANEIAFVLSRFGLKATVEENRTSTPLVPDGISVSYPIGRPWTAEEPNQPWFEWAKAANALADALTRAGLGVGERPVSRYGFVPVWPGSIGTLPFKPVTQGVLVLVGPRPVAETVEWIKQGRPDSLSNKPADAVPAKPAK